MVCLKFNQLFFVYLFLYSFLILTPALLKGGGRYQFNTSLPLLLFTPLVATFSVFIICLFHYRSILYLSSMRNMRMKLSSLLKSAMLLSRQGPNARPTPLSNASCFGSEEDFRPEREPDYRSQ